MSLVRPELQARLSDWREVIAAAVLAAAGLWIASRGGLIFVPLGACLTAAAAIWSVTAYRRMRFRTAIAAPGVVELVEGRIGYLGPTFGGFLSVPELVEVRLVALHGRQVWRLRQADGQVLLIPVDAAGSERLFDAFALLDGFDFGRATALRDGPGDGAGSGPAGVVVWQAAILRPAIGRQ